MVDEIRFRIEAPRMHRYTLPDWAQSYGDGLVYEHQWIALSTKENVGRIHARTGTGKSRAAAFFAVAPFLRGEEPIIQSTFIYPTNLLTKQQFEEGLLGGLRENLGFGKPTEREWSPGLQYGGSLNEFSIPYTTLKMPDGGDLYVSQMTGELMLKTLSAIQSGSMPKRGDLLLQFMSWLSMRHSFLVASPDILAYASHEMYGTTSVMYWRDKKKRLANLLRGRTLIIDEYHMYDAYTLVNLERLIDDDFLSPSRILLLSATPAREFFPKIGTLSSPENPSSPADEIVPASSVDVILHFDRLPEPFVDPEGVLSIWIHNSVIENRRRAERLRKDGIRLIQWDGTRKDDLTEGARLILGTSAVEVGLHLPEARRLYTEWWPTFVQGSQIVQRIGRIGRDGKGQIAEAHVFISPDAELKSDLSCLDGRSLVQEELLIKLEEVRPPRYFNRENQISYYFGGENEPGVREKLGLNPRDQLRYSFRIPGTQALFVDYDGFTFIYEEQVITRRYDLVPAIPEKISSAWRAFALALGIGEDRFYQIRGEVQDRTRKRVGVRPTGQIDDLKKWSLRHLYLVPSAGEEANDGRFI